MRTIARIAGAPFAHVERQGSARVLNVLTQDLDAIAVLFVGLRPRDEQRGDRGLPRLSLGTLSWQVLAFAAVTVLIGAAGFHTANTRELYHLHSSRQREDMLVHYFRALFDGAKELKLHRAHARIRRWPAREERRSRGRAAYARLRAVCGGELGQLHLSSRSSAVCCSC